MRSLPHENSRALQRARSDFETAPFRTADYPADTKDRFRQHRLATIALKILLLVYSHVLIQEKLLTV